MKGMRAWKLVSTQGAYPAARYVAEAGAVLEGLRGPKVANTLWQRLLPINGQAWACAMAAVRVVHL